MNEILIYGDIGWDNTAKDVSEQLKGFGGEPVTVKISSGGGDVFEGVAILNALRGYAGEVTTVVESIAASAASFIAVGAGGKVIARPNAEVMVHKAWSTIAGNADDIEKIKADLARQDVKIAGIYAGKAGGELDDWLARMSAETWYTANEALDAGLIDEVQDAKQPVEASVGGRRVLAQFKYSNRAAAPPPPLASRSESAADNHIHPQGEERSDGMSLTKEDIVALIRDEVKSIRNESVQISGEVDVNYPTDVKIVPTEKIKVEPVIGDKPAEPAEGEPVEEPVNDVDEPAGDSAAVQLAKQAGLTFAIGDIAEGFTAEVDEGGVVTITAPSGAEVGSTAAFTVLVNDTPVALSVTVRSLSEESEDEPAEEAAEAPVEPAAEAAPVNKIVLDADSYNELKAAAQFGWSAMESQKEKDLEAEVDQWITEGRISSALRTKAVAAIKRDATTARDLYGTNPKNTIPRAEVGYGRQSADDVDPDAAELRAKSNPFPKPKF